MRYLICLNLLFMVFISQELAAQIYLSEATNILEPSYTLKEFQPSESILIKEESTEKSEEEVANIQLRLYPDASDQNATLLLYLKNTASSTHLSVTDMLGHTVNIPIEGTLKSGFYEISVLPDQAARGIYIARFIIDGKVYTKHIIR